MRWSVPNIKKELYDFFLISTVLYYSMLCTFDATNPQLLIRLILQFYRIL